LIKVAKPTGSGSVRVTTLPAGSTLRFRYLAEGGVWFDDDTAEVWDGQGVTITIPG